MLILEEANAKLVWAARQTHQPYRASLAPSVSADGYNLSFTRGLLVFGLKVPRAVVDDCDPARQHVPAELLALLLRVSRLLDGIAPHDAFASPRPHAPAGAPGVQPSRLPAATPPGQGHPRPPHSVHAVALGPSKRDSYRIRFPVRERPQLLLASGAYDVVDCSEGGLRYQTRGGAVPEVGAEVQGRVCFPLDAEVNVAGVVVRALAGEVGVQFTTARIPLAVIMGQQRKLGQRG